MVRKDKMVRRLTINFFAFALTTQLLTTQVLSVQNEAKGTTNGDQHVRRIDFRDGSSIEAVFPNEEIKWSNISKKEINFYKINKH